MYLPIHVVWSPSADPRQQDQSCSDFVPVEHVCTYIQFIKYVRITDYKNSGSWVSFLVVHIVQITDAT